MGSWPLGQPALPLLRALAAPVVDGMSQMDEPRCPATVGLHNRACRAQPLPGAGLLVAVSDLDTLIRCRGTQL